VGSCSDRPQLADDVAQLFDRLGLQACLGMRPLEVLSLDLAAAEGHQHVERGTTLGTEGHAHLGVHALRLGGFEIAVVAEELGHLGPEVFAHHLGLAEDSVRVEAGDVLNNGGRAGGGGLATEEALGDEARRDQLLQALSTRLDPLIDFGW
jgi:hypothetical protein